MRCNRIHGSLLAAGPVARRRRRRAREASRGAETLLPLAHPPSRFVASRRGVLPPPPPTTSLLIVVEEQQLGQERERQADNHRGFTAPSETPANSPPPLQTNRGRGTGPLGQIHLLFFLKDISSAVCILFSSSFGRGVSGALFTWDGTSP